MIKANLDREDKKGGQGSGSDEARLQQPFIHMVTPFFQGFVVMRYGIWLLMFD